jgi:hypothetical protein
VTVSQTFCFQFLGNSTAKQVAAKVEGVSCTICLFSKISFSMNVHICDSSQLNMSMWWVIDFFPAFRKCVCTNDRVCYSYFAPSPRKISTNFPFSFTRNLKTRKLFYNHNERV